MAQRWHCWHWVGRVRWNVSMRIDYRRSGPRHPSFHPESPGSSASGPAASAASGRIGASSCSRPPPRYFLIGKSRHVHDPERRGDASASRVPSSCPPISGMATSVSTSAIGDACALDSHQRLPAVLRLQHRVPLGRQDPDDHLPDRGLVLDDQDGLVRLPSAPADRTRGQAGISASTAGRYTLNAVPMPDLAVDPDVPVGLLDDAVDGREPEARALPRSAWW